jgi:serine/threonine protein kinase
VPFWVNSFRIKPGTLIGNYRISYHLGRGFEGEVYAAQELGTGVKRAIKFHSEDHPDTTKYLALRARLLERLTSTGAVVQYCHSGREFLGGRFVPAVYHVLELVEGEELRAYLGKITGTKQQRTARALVLILGIASHIARVHRLGLALGDFESGQNILVRKSNGQPVFCDALFNYPSRANRDYRNDLQELRDLCVLILRRTRAPELRRLVLPVINRYLRHKPRRDVMRRVSRELEERSAGMSGKSTRYRVTSAR